MSRTLAAAVIVATALAVPTSASATVADGRPAKTVGVLLEAPAPGDGGVPAGGTYSVAVYVSDGDQTTTTPTDREVSLSFPAGVTVTHLTRLVPGRDQVEVPVPNIYAMGSVTRQGQSITDVAIAVPVTASAGWVADLTVDPGLAPGSTLATTATSAGQDIGSVTVPVVAADASPCATPTSPTLCAAATTVGSPPDDFAPTRTVATISWIPSGQSPTSAGFPAARITWGTNQVYTGSVDLPGAPRPYGELDSYLQAWIVSQGGGRLEPGALNVTAGPKLPPGIYTIHASYWGAFFGASSSGAPYAQSAEVLIQRGDSSIGVVAPRPVVIKQAPAGVAIISNDPPAG
jgi:hypothetical protein